MEAIQCIGGARSYCSSKTLRSDSQKALFSSMLLIGGKRRSLPRAQQGQARLVKFVGVRTAQKQTNITSIHHPQMRTNG